MGVHNRLLQAHIYGKNILDVRRPHVFRSLEELKMKWGEHPDHHEGVAAAMKFSETVRKCAACSLPIESERLEVLPDTRFCSVHAGQSHLTAPAIGDAVAVNSENTRNGFGKSD
jgi:hypothetical protein